jgi:hypothetical protein
MSDLVFTTVRTTRTASEAGLFISILEQAGLHPLELETANQSTFGGAEIFYSVKVPTEESAEAREILNAYASNSAYNKPDSIKGSKQESGPDNLKAVELGPGKRCVACNEEIPEDAKICPKCGWTQPA